MVLCIINSNLKRETNFPYLKILEMGNTIIIFWLYTLCSLQSITSQATCEYLESHQRLFSRYVVFAISLRYKVFLTCYQLLYKLYYKKMGSCWDGQLFLNFNLSIFHFSLRRHLICQPIRIVKPTNDSRNLLTHCSDISLHCGEIGFRNIIYQTL